MSEKSPSAKGASALRDHFNQPSVEGSAAAVESVLRPPTFADFTGQAKTVERLRVMVGAARARGEALNHILLSGPPGLGKTTLAFILGHEMGRKVRVTSGPVIEEGRGPRRTAHQFDRGRYSLHRRNSPPRQNR